MPSDNDHIFAQRLKQLATNVPEAVFHGGKIGLEKECLRVNENGGIAQTPHPQVLGSPLTHPSITTDYSEALLEFITPPCDSVGEALGYLSRTQKFVYDKLEGESLWATSMPCVVAGETSIPIAQYGSSNLGMMKTVYRRGLGHRYGRVMQVIAGVHFNYSFSDEFWRCFQSLLEDKQPLQQFISQNYFALLRNLQRVGWLIPYLFGASPAVCKSFLNGQQTALESFNENTFYEPHATSLRMGNIGYQNNAESSHGIKANYNSLDEYVASLKCAIETPCEDYEKIGVKVNGEYRQLNANILQIENEYYSSVRPKEILQGMEKPVLALQRRGVRYIELRSLDVNAYTPLGVSENQLRFLEMLMMYCLLQPSPVFTEQEQIDLDINELSVAHRGRDPELTLSREGQSISLRDWGLDICRALRGISQLFDRQNKAGAYQSALDEQIAALRDSDLTPSARMLAEMRQNKEGFFHFAQRMSETHSAYFKSMQLAQQDVTHFEAQAAQSIEKQHALEQQDHTPFDTFLQNYFNQHL